MILLVGIEIKGAALRDDPESGSISSEEVARILRDLADRVEDGGNYFSLRDYNGNTVGSAEYRMQDELSNHDL